MCGHGRESMMKVWVENEKGKKTPVPFLVDECQPETNTHSALVS